MALSGYITAVIPGRVLAGETGGSCFALANFRQTPHTVTTVLTRAYLSLGSNLGERAAHLQRALGQLAGLGSVTKGSSMYETEPVEFTAQPEFLNCVVAIETLLSAQELLAGILAIERDMGRNRAEQPPKGPRTLDIDILLFGDTVVSSPDLTIPHPAMHLRRFVLEPLVEIAGDLRHPVLHCTMRELLDGLPVGQAVRRLPGSLEERASSSETLDKYRPRKK